MTVKQRTVDLLVVGGGAAGIVGAKVLAVRFFDDGGVMVGVDVGGVGKPRWMVPAGLSLSG